MVDKMSFVRARYEFRVFDYELRKYFSKLMELSSTKLNPETPDERYSEEIYLIPNPDKGLNCKIRNEIFDIKSLIGIEDNLEQWKPVYKSHFPMSSTDLQEIVFPLFGIENINLSQVNHTFDELVFMLRSKAEMRTAHVEKRRFGFLIDDVICEYGKICIEGNNIETVACESESKEKVISMIDKLNIRRFDNTNYVSAIIDILSG